MKNTKSVPYSETLETLSRFRTPPVTVKAPWWIEKAESEDQKFFIAYAWYIGKKYGMRNAYILQTGDISTFFAGRKKMYYGNSDLLKPVNKWLMMAKVTKVLWRFHFNKTNAEEIDWTVTNEKRIIMWNWLMYLDSMDQTFDKKQLGLGNRWKYHQLSREIIKWLVDR